MTMLVQQKLSLSYTLVVFTTRNVFIYFSEGKKQRRASISDREAGDAGAKF